LTDQDPRISDSFGLGTSGGLAFSEIARLSFGVASADGAGPTHSGRYCPHPTQYSSLPSRYKFQFTETEDKVICSILSWLVGQLPTKFRSASHTEFHYLLILSAKKNIPDLPF
jgi:hypothetical protein